MARVDWILIIVGTQVIKKKRPVRLNYLCVFYDYVLIAVISITQGTDESYVSCTASSEATVQRCSNENMFLSNFIEIRLRHGCSPVNLLHIFRTPFLEDTSGWLLLKISRIRPHRLYNLGQFTHFALYTHRAKKN